MRFTPIVLIVSTALLAACSHRSAPTGGNVALYGQLRSGAVSAEAADFDSAAMGTFARMNPAAANAAAKRSDHAVAEYAAPMVMPMIAPAEHIRQPENTERYADTPANPVQAVAQSPVSTFGVDVDTGSYANVRRFLNDGPQGAVRVEEIVNYFDYDYATPKNGAPFAVRVDTADSPWQPNAKLVRIAIKAKEMTQQALPPANLVFLVDVSGSMSSADKLPLVKQTLRLLTERLRAQDKVTLITYASGEKLVLPPTSGANKNAILAAVNSLQAGGATAGEQAIQMAYREAEKPHLAGNRWRF